MGYKGLFDGLLRSLLVGANEFGFAVDDHLWGVNSAGLELSCIAALTIGKLFGGVWVFPAKVVPVVDVIRERVDVLPGGLGMSCDFFKVSVCAWATAAAFGCE